MCTRAKVGATTGVCKSAGYEIVAHFLPFSTLKIYSVGTLELLDVEEYRTTRSNDRALIAVMLSFIVRLFDVLIS